MHFLTSFVEYQSQQSSSVVNCDLGSFLVVNTAMLLEFGHCIVGGNLLN